jgi:hypothetical protein
MDTQNITLTATENVAPTTSAKMTKEELQLKSDIELLALVEKSKGHTGNDFSEYMNCDFSYSFLTTTLKDRGYENGWHKTSEGNSPVIKPTAICMKKSDKETTRKSFIIDEDVASEWKEFNKNVPFPSVTLGFALRRFMDDYKSGLIKFELEI